MIRCKARKVVPDAGASSAPAYQGLPGPRRTAGPRGAQRRCRGAESRETATAPTTFASAAAPGTRRRPTAGSGVSRNATSHKARRMTDNSSCGASARSAGTGFSIRLCHRTGLRPDQDRRVMSPRHALSVQQRRIQRCTRCRNSRDAVDCSAYEAILASGLCREQLATERHGGWGRRLADMPNSVHLAGGRQRWSHVASASAPPATLVLGDPPADARRWTSDGVW